MLDALVLLASVAFPTLAVSSGTPAATPAAIARLEPVFVVAAASHRDEFR